LTKNAATHNYVLYLFLLFFTQSLMELNCIKYNEIMAPENAVCRHPGDYCKYRTSCVIHFLGREKETSARHGQVSSDKKDTGNSLKDSQ